MVETKLAKWQKGKNENNREAKAHGLGPNPRAQLSRIKLIKWSSSTHGIKKEILLHLEGLKQQNPNRMEMDGMGWNGMKIWNGLYRMDQYQMSGPEWNRIDPN